MIARVVFNEKGENAATRALMEWLTGILHLSEDSDGALRITVATIDLPPDVGVRVVGDPVHGPLILEIDSFKQSSYVQLIFDPADPRESLGKLPWRERQP